MVWSFATLGLTSYSRLGLLKDEINISGFLNPRFVTMSCCTLGVAVAVSAMMGALD